MQLSDLSSLWNDVRVRRIAIQVILLALSCILFLVVDQQHFSKSG